MSEEKLWFSYVWEDPRVESFLLQQQCSAQLSRMLMIGSAGDTLLYILGNNCTDIVNKHFLIDVCDCNKLQIALCVLKLLILHGLNNKLDFTPVFRGTVPLELANVYTLLVSGYEKCDYVKLISILRAKYNDLPYIHFLDVWLDYINVLEYGAIFAGELEKLIRMSINSNMSFEQFNDMKLTQSFGDSAINLAIDNSFIDKFRGIYEKYKSVHGQHCENNKFYFRMLNGFDDSRVTTELVNKFEAMSYEMLLNINFVHEPIETFVAKQSNVYDIIQTSNVTDWLNTEVNAVAFIKNVYRASKYNGKMLWRSLNGAYDLVKMLKMYSVNCENVYDESYFYNVVCITQKELNVNTLMLDIEKMVNKESIIKHSYFSRLHNKSLTLPEFYKTQIPFIHAVKNWVVVLQKLSVKLKIINQVELDELLWHNINDELGINDNTKTITHVMTFREFLNAISANEHKEEYEVYALHVKEFNDMLNFIIDTKSLSYVCAYLGMIEYQYIFVSTLIKNYVDDHKIEQPHYTMHEVMDVQHSHDLFHMSIALSNGVNDVYEALHDSLRNFMKLYEMMLNLL